MTEIPPPMTIARLRWMLWELRFVAPIALVMVTLWCLS